MREIIISQLNVLILLILVCLAGTIKIFSILGSIGNNNTPSGITECTVSVNKKTGTSKVEKFPAGTDCDAMRKLKQEGKPLPTIINSPPTTVP